MAESNSKQLEKEQCSQDLKHTKTRRSFLKKATIGATIASIPAHSVWAGRLISGNMSGNVSGWSECEDLAIFSHGRYRTSNKHHTEVSSYLILTWKSVFGLTRAPFNDKETSPDENNNLQHFIDLNGVNAQLATMYINAARSTDGGPNGDGVVYWPVVTNGTFSSAEAYAEYLWDQADQYGASQINNELGDIITQHHVGKQLACN